MSRPRSFLVGFSLTCIFAIHAVAQPLPKAHPAEVGMSAEQLARVRPVIQEAIEDGYIPGAVLLVARHGRVVIREAFGYAQIVPTKKKMTPDMIFDLASITKPMATATSMMILIEQGKLRLQDRISQFVPDFRTFQATNGGSAPAARLYHLLTHTSGLPPYYNADSLQKRYGYTCSIDSSVAFMGRLDKSNAPGDEFHYSCLGFITQAKIIKQVSGMDVHRFSRKHIFGPLGLRHTGFIPQIGKTEPDPGSPLMQS